MKYLLTLIAWLSLSLPGAASVLVDVAPFTLLTSADTQTATGNMGGVQPKGALIITTGNVTPGTMRADSQLAFCAHSPSSSWCTGGQGNSGDTVTDSDSWQEVGYGAGIQNPDRSMMCQATIPNFVNNGIRLTQAVGCDQAYQGAALLFGGTDTRCKASIFQAPAGIGTSTDVNNVGFEPDVVFIAKTRMDSFTAGGNASQIMNIGIAVNHPVASDVNAGVAWVNQNGQNPSQVGAYVSTTSLYTLDVFTGDGEYTVSFDSLGFNVLQGVEASADEFGYLACDFNGKAQFYLGVVNTPATADAGAHAFTGPGFRPLLSMWLMTGVDTANAIEVTAGASEDPGSFGIGLLRGGQAWSGSVSAEDAATGAVTRSLVSTTDIRMPLHSASLGWQGAPSHTSTGASILFTTNPATARKWVYFAMKTTARRRAPGNN